MHDEVPVETTPAAEIEVETFDFEDDGTVPNNPELPVVLMRAALGQGGASASVERHLQNNGWGGTWTWRVFDYHHFHPNAHEVLAVARGQAVLALGGPSGARVEIRAGDVVVLPAGTGHKQIEASDDFEICGAYPPGQEGYETIRADGPHDGAVADRIAAVARPATCPVHGADGPLMRVWGEGSGSA
ncbi:cupin domain-containing protein [Palleronia sp. LCG004]|uniref:cupin domain-containing protein n=1 Tax=Palleronia sp. LCG004 TaxID=3079304 RepID=UPI0029429D47|nr:cupin domain-containing protein [Palleronia sp. LCG004]WOI57856.1 cupin domain-containing protein [Palleronia sp. LCG004]